MDSSQTPAELLYIRPGEGRFYALGKMTAIFKADEEETRERYSISEWWLDPYSTGPGAHLHEANDEIFYVLEGTASILAGEEWLEAPKGSFLRIPAGTIHDFENRSGERTGLLNFFIPGGFEHNMPTIVEWFANNP